MPQTNPTRADIHVNRPLTNFAQRYLLDANMFVATRAFPMLPVSKQSDLYYVYDKGDWMRSQAKVRAPGTESAGAGWTLSTESYFCKVRSIHKDVTEDDRANADEVINLDEDAAAFVTQQLMLEREIDFATTFMTAASWGTNTNVDWSSASSTPIANVRTAKRTVQSNTGKIPNKMLIGRQAYDTLVDNDDILSRITGGANTQVPAMVMRQLLAQVLELDEIFVMDAVYNTANEGATDSFSFVGGDTAIVYYAPNVASRYEPSAGITFSWTGKLGNTNAGLRIKRFFMDQIESDRVEGEMAYDNKITGSALGYAFNTVSAA